ncbi:hypothetical protein Goklo_010000, partial [Gossypium klotzschianum]|nr:hypothetical protein [Gossypium klotzschianum]
IHLKTDGVVEINIGCDAARGVLRDYNANWILGFNRIVYGVALVQRRQHDKILVQTDNMEGVENWSIEHVLREDNAEANHIAKLAFDRGEGFQLHIVSLLDSF